MAISNSRQARKEAERKLNFSIDYYRNYFNQYFNNSIIIKNPPTIPADYKSKNDIELPKRYLLKTLREMGGIAYDKLTGMYLRYTKRELDVYGLPKEYCLYGYNGFIASRKPSDVVILRANDLEYPVQEYIDMQATKLANCDNAIFQNLDACKTMSIVQCPNEKSLLSLVNIDNARRIGSSVAFVSNSPSMNELQVASTGATYLADKIQELRTQILRETLSNLGFSVSNEDKRERVQSAELTTLNTHGLDAINVLIDTFNYDAEYGGLDIRLESNTELSRLIEMDNEEIVDEELGENKDD